MIEWPRDRLCNVFEINNSEMVQLFLVGAQLRAAQLRASYIAAKQLTASFMLAFLLTC